MSAAPTSQRPRREDAPKDRVLCEFCSAKCCGYFALPIDTPKKWEDFDTMRWYLAHQDVSIFVDENVWYLMVHRPCNHLQPDNRCGVYDDRMQICRDYTTDNCEYDDDTTYEQVFETDDQLWEYAEALLGAKNVRQRSAPTLRLVVGGA